MNSIVANMALAQSGHDKINWVKNFMPVMSAIERGENGVHGGSFQSGGR